jgi:predicted protein tyrosine phosphatase
MKRLKLLFVCTSNQIRSVTAEKIYKYYHRYEVLSCVIDKNAMVRLDEILLLWPNIIFCFEEIQKEYIVLKNSLSEIKRLSLEDSVYNLDIPDIYDPYQIELVKLIKEKVDKILDNVSY